MYTYVCICVCIYIYIYFSNPIYKSASANLSNSWILLIMTIHCLVYFIALTRLYQCHNKNKLTSIVALSQVTVLLQSLSLIMVLSNTSESSMSPKWAWFLRPYATSIRYLFHTPLCHQYWPHYIIYADHNSRQVTTSPDTSTLSCHVPSFLRARHWHWPNDLMRVLKLSGNRFFNSTGPMGQSFQSDWPLSMLP